MRCPYINCRLRTKEDLCELTAEHCKMYNIHRRNEQELKEIEMRFGEVQAEDIRRIYTERQ